MNRNQTATNPVRTWYDRDGRRPVAAAIAALILLLGLIGPAGTPSAQAATGRPEVVIDGRGWGHGRGMSQYGALGYATDFGWSSAQILDHYYGGTTAGQAPRPGAVDQDNLRVDLVYMRGRPTTIGLDSGTMELFVDGGAVVAAASGAVRLILDGTSMLMETAPDCNGPWTTVGRLFDTEIRVRAVGGSADQSGMLHVCGPSYWTWYDGEIWATKSSSGSQRTVNPVSVEQYLRGVVPNEVPASWDSAALEAQAVAARSYALAGDTRWSSWAETCDSTLCQVYDGRFTTRGGGLRTATHARTDAAIAATAGLVRLKSNSSVARTEFSSSSGGYTTGPDFPPVADLGDAVAANPNSNWQVTVDLGDFEESYDRGALLGMAVVERNGLGADGGRVVEANFYFEDGTVSLDGDDVRRKFGLKSNWFRFGRFTRDGSVVSDVDLESAARFVDQAFRTFNGRAPSSAEVDQWERRLRTAQRQRLTEELVYSDQYAGVVLDELYQIVFGRAADPAGRQYWLEQMEAGLKYEQVGTLFYGSSEYVLRAGQTDQGFIDALYRDLLGRPADSQGRSYWLQVMAEGRATSIDVANAFYVSLESRRDRSRAVHLRILGREPDTATNDLNAARLLLADDLILAAELATELGGSQ